MAFGATFYTFSKKKNSTKRPTGGTTFNINIKDDSSILNPTILLERSTSPIAYNYCYISRFNRYYFVSDWVLTHDMWIANLTVDTLASYKTDIVGSTQFVLRSASENNAFIEDSAYPVTANSEVTSKSAGPNFTGQVFRGTTYILAVTNSSTQAKINGVQYLALSQSDFNNLIYQVLNDSSDYWGTGSVEAGFGITSAVMRSIVNPLQYISAAYLLPFTVHSSRLTNISGLKVGSWNLPYTGTLNALNTTENINLGDENDPFEWDISIDRHPQNRGASAFHGTYLNNNPYSQYYIYAGPFGCVRLDNSVMLDHTGMINSLHCKVRVDFLGKAVLEVTNATNGDIVAKAYADVSVQIPLTQTRNDILTWMGSYAGAIGSAASGNYINTAAAAAGCVSSIDNILPKPEIKGYAGSIQVIREPWTLQEEFHLVANNDSNATNILGKPLMELRQLSTLSGYCQTDKPWLDIAAYDPEHEEIISYMTSGFFIE